MEVNTTQHIIEENNKIAYLVPDTGRVFTNLEDALNSVAKSIKFIYENETLSRLIAFETEYGYIVKCTNNLGKKRVRKIVAILKEHNSNHYEKSILKKWNEE